MKQLDNAFNITPDVVEDEKVGITPEQKPDRFAKDEITRDYEYTRGNLYSIIEKGQEAINGILELAQESDQPRAYEVAGQLIKSVSDATDKLMDLQKKLKDVETTLSEQTIPNLMQQAGVELIKLEGGISVEVKPFYSARIPVSKSEEAFEWLRENGHGDLIKNQVSLEFGMKQDNEAKSIIEELKAKGLPVKQKTTCF